MSNKALFFFSRDGSTKMAAGLLAERVDAEMIELQEEKPNRGFLRSGFMAKRKKRTALRDEPWNQCADRDTWILGTPIWAGNGTPAINAFLDEADLTNKKVYLFTVQADPRLKDSASVMEYLSSRVGEAGGTVAGTLALHGAAPGKTAEAGKFTEKLTDWDIA